MEAVIDTDVLIYEFIEDSEYHNEVKKVLNNKKLVFPLTLSKIRFLKFISHI